MKHKGFTVVELIVVIVVIAILAGITIVAYSFVRDDAMDTRIKSTVKSVGDAIALYEQKNARPSVEGYLSAPNGVDALLTPKFLNNGYRDGIVSRNAPTANSVFRWRSCEDGGGGFIVYASLNNPSDGDIANFDSLRTSCGHEESQVPATGSVKYNYAQAF